MTWHFYPAGFDIELQQPSSFLPEILTPKQPWACSPEWCTLLQGGNGPINVQNELTSDIAANISGPSGQ